VNTTLLFASSRADYQPALRQQPTAHNGIRVIDIKRQKRQKPITSRILPINYNCCDL